MSDSTSKGFGDSRRTRRIVCGSDFSEHAGSAGEVAASLAKQWEGEVTLVHAFNFPELNTAEDLTTQWRADRRQALRRQAVKLRPWGVPVETMAEDGKPATSRRTTCKTN